MPVGEDFHTGRGSILATIAHNRALPARKWPALGMPRGTARSDAASAVAGSRHGGACAGGCRRLGRWFVRVAVLPVCGEFPEEEAALGNHSAQSPTSAL